MVAACKHWTTRVLGFLPFLKLEKQKTSQCFTVIHERGIRLNKEKQKNYAGTNMAGYRACSVHVRRSRWALQGGPIVYLEEGHERRHLFQILETRGGTPGLFTVFGTAGYETVVLKRLTEKYFDETQRPNNTPADPCALALPNSIESRSREARASSRRQDHRLSRREDPHHFSSWVRNQLQRLATHPARRGFAVRHVGQVKVFCFFSRMILHVWSSTQIMVKFTSPCAVWLVCWLDHCRVSRFPSKRRLAESNYTPAMLDMMCLHFPSCSP